MAMAGSLAAVVLVGLSGKLAASESVLARWLIGVHAPLIVAVVGALAASLLAGLWNGALVAYVRVQPIVATLVLMVAGRGIAQLLTDGQSISVTGHPDFAFLGLGTLLGLPVPIWIAALAAVVLGGLTRWTALGLFIESVGGNEVASRFVGLNVRGLRLAVYAVAALCAAVAGLIYTSNITVSDANNAGLYMELDAILAVVLGGTALTGGRFSIIGTLVGALIIQTLSTTILMFQFHGTSIPPEYNLVAKAIVVLVVCLLQRLLLVQRGTA
jgi:simple sugar transport system permease protein